MRRIPPLSTLCLSLSLSLPMAFAAGGASAQSMNDTSKNANKEGSEQTSSKAAMPAETVGTPTATGKAANNTGVNVRDRGGATETPQTQPNAATDRKMLAAVRRAVIADKSLSSSAHNVKIVAKAGVVTLRGPVKTDEEKNRIEKLAMQVAGVSNVENQLDVKNR